MCKLSSTGRIQDNTNKTVHQIRGEPGRRRNFQEKISELRKVTPILRDLTSFEILTAISKEARLNCVSNSTVITYSTGIRSFLAFLAIFSFTLESVMLDLPDVWRVIMVNFVTYLFVVTNLKLSTITTYLAGVQHHLVMNDVPKSVWSKNLHQVMKGYERKEAIFSPMNERAKIPFTRHMILVALDWLSCRYGKENFWVLAMHAALCMGFMFLFRKSEFLTKSDGKPKVNDSGIIVTLQAEDVELWFNGIGFKATD